MPVDELLTSHCITNSGCKMPWSIVATPAATVVVVIFVCVVIVCVFVIFAVSVLISSFSSSSSVSSSSVSSSSQSFLRRPLRRLRRRPHQDFIAVFIIAAIVCVVIVDTNSMAQQFDRQCLVSPFSA